MNDKTLLIMAELEDNNLKPVTFDLVAAALKMTGGATRSILMAVTGTSPDAAASEAASRTGIDVLAVTVTASITSDIRKQAAAFVAGEFAPSYILCPHSAEGTDYAPALAVRLNAACISAVSGVVIDVDGNLLFSRSICGGQFNALIKPATSPAVIMIQPGAFQVQAYEGTAGAVETTTFEAGPGALRMNGVEKSRETSSELDKAKVIVSAGRGIGEPGNLDAIRRFAALFPGSAVGGSRPLIDMGWLEYRHQVGITGATVSPSVYIACGISGSTQHIAGMNGSGYVIAINSDPNAAIFNYSDLCIVDDIMGFIEAFEDFIKNGEG